MKICKTCHGGCCRRYNPDVTGYDILKISKALDVDLNFFASAIPVDKDYLKIALGKIPLFVFTDSGEKQYYRFSLKVVESKHFPGTAKCVFLQEWDAKELGSEELEGIISRCGIYDIRPHTCRTFPAKLDEQTKEGIIQDPYSNFEKDDSKAYELCPRPIEKSDYEAYSASVIESLALYQYEMNFFLKLSKKWNKNPDISDNFIDFLYNEYNNRLSVYKK